MAWRPSKRRRLSASGEDVGAMVHHIIAIEAHRSHSHATEAIGRLLDRQQRMQREKRLQLAEVESLEMCSIF